MTTEAIILAGGFGTRLQEVVTDIPKSMALVNGKPFLEYQLNFLEGWGIDHIVLSVGYKKEHIMDYFGDTYKTVRINYAIEEEALGTGGGIMNAMQHIEENPFFVFNGDTFFDVNLRRLHQFKRVKEADICIVMKKVKDISRYGALDINEDKRIMSFIEKGSRQGEGYINGGVYLLNKRFMQKFDLPEKFSIEKDFFEKQYADQRIYGFDCHAYFLDIGIPEDYHRAQDEFKKLPY